MFYQFFWNILDSDLKNIQRVKKTRKQWRYVNRSNAYRIIGKMKDLGVVNKFFRTWKIYVWLKRALGKADIENQEKVEGYLRRLKHQLRFVHPSSKKFVSKMLGISNN